MSDIELQEKINNLPSLPIKANMKNYTNQRRGKIIFLKPAEKKNGRIYWWTLCDCGNIQQMRSDTTAISCKECSIKAKVEKRKNNHKKVDLTNHHFGKLIALYPQNFNSSFWHCKCECGNECTVLSYNLISGNTKSCGCLRKEATKQMGLNNLHDLTGQKFGYLTVLQDSKERNQNHDVIWICKCICGKITKVAGNDLRKGGTKSCGCKKQELNLQTRIQKMIGKKFGKLTVLEVSETKNSDGSYNYLCQCECGNLKVINGIHLRNGETSSCGCITKSIGEQNIRKILQENNIHFESEKTFPDCVFSDTKKPARYDFYINNRLIEFDGRQHFEGWKWGKSTFQQQLNTLKKIQEHDTYKDQWAKNHNIPLVRIPYTERDHITLDMLLGDKYLVNRDA